MAWRAALAPSEYRNPTPQPRYHLVVVGAGPAGLIAAIGAAGLGAKVALVERHYMGGDCLNVGCVPSKALLEYTAAHSNPEFAGAFAWLREVRAGIAPHDSVTRYTELGVDVFLGHARLTRGGRVSVEGLELNARRVAICTGARADIPPIPGLSEVQPLTNESVFDLQQRPQSLAILGAGPIGCELAQVFARLGVEVHLFELATRILPLESEVASAGVAAQLTLEGVILHLGQGVSAVAGAGPTTVTAGDESVTVERVLVALGRKPNTDALDLDVAGVDLDEHGWIKVDAKLRTSRKHIYAAGDCAARLQFTHHADAQARVLVQNALFAPTAKVDGLIVPHCTYTQPEVASVGLSAAVLQEQATPFDHYTVAFDELDRGRAEPNGGGFAEVYTRRGTDKILGATIMGHDAGEQLASICLLMSNGLGLSAVGKTLLSYPTRSEYLKRLADAYNRTRLTPTTAKVMARWLSIIK